MMTSIKLAAAFVFIGALIVGATLLSRATGERVEVMLLLLPLAAAYVHTVIRPLLRELE